MNKFTENSPQNLLLPQQLSQIPISHSLLCVHSYHHPGFSKNSPHAILQQKLPARDEYFVQVTTILGETQTWFVWLHWLSRASALTEQYFKAAFKAETIGVRTQQQQLLNQSKMATGAFYSWKHLEFEENTQKKQRGIYLWQIYHNHPPS